MVFLCRSIGENHGGGQMYKKINCDYVNTLIETVKNDKTAVKNKKNDCEKPF